MATPAGVFAPARLCVTWPPWRRIAAIIEAVVVFPLVAETRTQRFGSRRERTRNAAGACRRTISPGNVVAPPPLARESRRA